MSTGVDNSPAQLFDAAEYSEHISLCIQNPAHKKLGGQAKTAGNFACGFFIFTLTSWSCDERQ
jgi:hypothetical protein